jgi:uncharacterized protein DUF1801
VSAEDVDEYLRAVDEPKRSVLQTLRRTILDVVPDAEQVISYGVPAFCVRGKTVAGFAAFNTHLSYLPFSGSVLGQLAEELDGRGEWPWHERLSRNDPLCLYPGRSRATCIAFQQDPSRRFSLYRTRGSAGFT